MSEWLSSALRIADHLTETAVWADGSCTWRVVTPDPADPASRTPQITEAGPLLYHGVAGIGLFLAEAQRLAPDPGRGRALRGALQHCADNAAALQTNAFGFHCGRVGVAWTLARAAGITREQQWRDAAEAVLAPLIGQESEDAAPDVIGGAAGAIPVLLQLSDDLQNPAWAQMARTLGAQLLCSAHRHVRGWSWGTWPSTHRLDLCGYAHGASGFGHALLELWNQCGDADFLYGAEQAFRYEDSYFDRTVGNWPDFRDLDLYHLMRADAPTRQTYEEFASRPWRPSFMSAWCHGAPGIGLARVRAWELLGSEHHRQAAENAVRATRASFAEVGGYSLCHGRTGNAELLLAASTMGDVQSGADAERVLSDGLERFANRPEAWPSGAIGGLPDPSLLMGTAGIGHFMLRLHDASVPSVLLFRPRSSKRVVDTAQLAASADRDRRRALSATMQAVEMAGHVPPPPGIDGVGAALAWLDRTYVVDGGPVVSTAAAVERAHLEMDNAMDDLAQEWLRQCARPSWTEVVRERRRLSVAPDVRLVVSTRPTDGTARASTNAAVVLYTYKGRVHSRELNDLTLLLLGSLYIPLTIADAIARLADSTDAASSDLETFALQQLKAAYIAGIVRPHSASET